eukprot:TRINITY_DN9991_c0_g1_i1.p1 TRINITY_DN9991_c0_g1~~TRINITY_DN9991_c0_g1_i1.p1  ORF type:complete len:350 (+),score=121.01 TRINITY_DN9991_c0_g1_i1:1-1050(+)
MADGISIFLKYVHSGGQRATTSLLNKTADFMEDSSSTAAPTSPADTEIDSKVSKSEAIPTAPGVERFGFGQKNYRSKKGSKMWISIRSDSYESVKTAWKVWDSSVILSRWLYANKDVINGRRVLEVGSGCGLSGLMASHFASETTLSDLLPSISDMIRESALLNYPEMPSNLHVRELDWKEYYGDSGSQTARGGFDVIIAADVIYNTEQAAWLPCVADALLERVEEEGAEGEALFHPCFIAVLPKNRLGVDEFIEQMGAKGFFLAECGNPAEELFGDISRKSHWSFLRFERRSQKEMEQWRLQEEEKERRKMAETAEDRAKPRLVLEEDEDGWFDFEECSMFANDSSTD